MMRGRGAPRGMRGGRGMPRGVSASSGGGGGMNTEAMYEDVYEAVPPGPPATTMPYSNSYINGSSVSAKNSYFEEFPEPGMSSSGDSMLSGMPRHNHPKNVRLHNNHVAVAATSAAMAVRQHQKAF